MAASAGAASEGAASEGAASEEEAAASVRAAAATSAAAAPAEAGETPGDAMMAGRIGRFFRHLWFDETHARRAVPPAMAERLKQRVAASEQRHSGQIRICVEAGLPPHLLWRDHTTRALTHARALAVFSELRVWDTEHDNGVLIYLLLAERAIEIVADRGLARHVAPQTWRELIQRMGGALRQCCAER